MTSAMRSVMLVVALASQVVTPGVPTIGEPDVVARLNDTDIAVIRERAHDTCATLWVVKAFRGQLADSQYVEAYCAAVPSQQGPVYLRRGAYVGVIDRPAKPWAVLSKGQYAQVSADARTPDQVPGDRDIRRPFRINGSFTDAELLSLVAYIRSSPANPAADRYQPRVEGGWPMTGVWKHADGSVEVALARDDMSAQRVQVRPTSRGWEIVRIDFVIA